MSFELKNAGATFHIFINNMFTLLIRKHMEVYVDDMLVKSIKGRQHEADLKESFQILCKYNMKLNPTKRTCEVILGKFSSFLVHQRGIKVNSYKVQAILEMSTPTNLKQL